MGHDRHPFARRLGSALVEDSATGGHHAVLGVDLHGLRREQEHLVGHPLDLTVQAKDETERVTNKVVIRDSPPTCVGAITS